MTLLVNYLVHVLAVFGAAYIAGHSQITLAFRMLLARSRVGRFFVDLLECPACFSVHAAWVLTVFNKSLFERSFWGGVGACCFYAGTSFLLARLTGLTLGPPRYFTGSSDEKHITEV